MKKILPITLIIFLPFALSSQERSNHKIEELFYKANQFYKHGKYEDALNSYLMIVQSEHVSGDLYYNMGNTCYRLNMIGHAILYYERARVLMPRNSDLDYNLGYARKLTKDAVDTPIDIISSTLFWTKSTTVNESFWIFAVINSLFWSVLILRLYVKKEWTYYLPFILLVLWLIAGASWGWKYYLNSIDDRAVVLTEEVNVLSGPDEREKLLFQLHAGTIVTQERSEDNWKLIRLDDRRGWVRDGDVEKINIQHK